MDDDSMDELVDRSPGPGAHRRRSAAPLASDPEGSSDGDSVGSEEDTGSELSGGSDGEDKEGDPEDGSGSEDSEDEDDVEIVADTPGSLEAGGALNSDDDSESCPICLNAFRDQVVGTPQSCAHYFCLDCIVEWSKNANSCPVDRTLFKCICVRAHFGGKILRKIPVENARAGEGEEEEDPTFCEVCGRSDREDRLLLCDGCDAGYHMECLQPPLQEVPVDEWFCPECAAPTSDTAPVSEEEVSLLWADVVPTSSRLRPRAGRTRAIARTRQSERVRATVNRNRMSTARSIQHVPRYLMSSLFDEAIEAVASGLSTAVYQRSTAPRVPARRRRRAGRRKKVLGRKKTQCRPSVRSRGPGTRSKKRQGRVRKRKGKQRKSEATARWRIARTLGLQRPVHGACIPSVLRPAEPSLGLMRADIGAASLSLFGDPCELDPFDSTEEPSVSPASPLSAKRRVLSRSALRSHQPVARPVSLGLSRSSVPAMAPELEVGEVPVPDLLGSILSGQSLLMMDSADITIHRDGSLSAKRAAPVSSQRSSGGGEGPGPGDSLQPRGLRSGDLGSLGSQGQGRPAPSCVPVLTSGAVVRLDSSGTPRSGQGQSMSNGSGPGVKRRDSPQLDSDSKRALPAGCASKVANSNSPSKSAGVGQAPRPVPRRTDISELPRIPKIRRGGGGGQEHAAPTLADGQHVDIPSSCISRLTGREGPRQPSLGARAEGEPRGRGPQEPSMHSRGGAQPPAPLGPSRGKGGSSTFQSFRINIPGNTAHAGRLSHPGFCNTFRPVDSKVQRKESPSPLLSLRKSKQLKSEIYDPFDPTGSDSSSAGSSPEQLGPGLLPSEITRTISMDSPPAPPLTTVRCVTSYTVGAAPGAEPEPPQGPPSSMLRLQGAGPPDGLGEEEPPEGRSLAPRAQRPSPPEPWEDEDRLPRSSFFGSEERTVTCVTEAEPDVLPTATHRVVQLRPPPHSRSRSTSSSRSRKKARRKQAPVQQRGGTHSGSRSGSHSRDGSSRSVSPPVSEDLARRPQPKARSRRSSNDRSSSRERAKRRKAKGRERSRGSRGPSRRRSRSGSLGSSSLEHHDGSRRRKRRCSGSRARSRGCSPHSSLDRVRRPPRPRERSREPPRDRRGRSRERRKPRSRSPTAEHRSREHRRPHSREKQPRPRSPERKLPVKVASPAPPPQEEPPPARPPALGGAHASPGGSEATPKATPVPEVPAECPEDMDYGDSVEAGHVFDDFPSEDLFMQLDDMSSPPSPESSTDSSPERVASPGPTAGWAPDTCLAMAVIRREVSLIHSEDTVQPLPWAEGPQESLSLQPGSAKAAVVPGALGGLAVVREEGVPHTPALRGKALVKRVTWNLQEAPGSAPAEDRGPRTLLHRRPQPQEEAWDAEDRGLVVATQLPEPLAPGPLLPEPSFPNADATQGPRASDEGLGAPSASELHSVGCVVAPVCSPVLPPTPAPPVSGLPYAPASQPAPQLLQGSLPLAACGAALSPAPVPTIPTSASEPSGHTDTTNSEERTAARPVVEKAKHEEYMKKLHVQERAVEEVKLAIKPFYQKREVTKDEYKDILRKAVQKICHSKSGEVNPVKVGNLVRAYVDKYRHMRRRRRPGPAEQSAAPAAEG